MNKIFALVDCNSFYASCEKVFRQDLKDKPVVVLSSNDGRIVDLSKEAKKLGTKRRILGVVILLFKSLYIEGLILTNPAQDIPAGIFGKKKAIKEIFSQNEISDFLNRINIDTNLKERAMFGLMYSSGLRVVIERV